MSICPSSDIHSVYLDGELPEAYRADYEAHVKGCVKCSAELAKLRSVREFFQKDAASIATDNLDKSWERLNARLSYSKVTKFSASPSNLSRRSFATAAGIAAALVIGVMLPLRSAGDSAAPQTVATITPISRNTSVALSKNNVVINGSIEQPGDFASFAHANARAASVETYAGPFIQNVSEQTGAEVRLNDVDVFRPNFDEGQAITIRINIQGMMSAPLSANINLQAAGGDGSLP